MNRRQRLKVLHDEWVGCTRCSYSTLRDTPKIVFGDGSLNVDYLFVGSHPNENDEDLGFPFTGDEGDLLLALAESANIEPDQTYLTYCVGCRPKAIIPPTEDEPERVETLRPDKEQMLTCRPRLWEQIYILDPRIIVAFGEEPLRALEARENTGKRPPKMSEAHGKLYDIQIPGKTGMTLYYPVLSALGPDYAIKNPSEAVHGPIASIQETLTRAHSFVEWVKEHEVP